MDYFVLAINPGSTSTKIAIYKNDDELLKKVVDHPVEIIHKFGAIHEQYQFRLETILQTLEDTGFKMEQLSAVVGRGGFVRPIASGTYLINGKMIYDLNHPWNEQESNLGGLIANEIAIKLNIPAFIVDPVVVDELDDVARISGLSDIERKSMFHPLNQKATARKFAEKINRPYEELNLVVAHMGGGISIGAHKQGKVIDVSNGLDAEGPFSPERAGTLPLKPLVKMCFSGEFTEKEILQKIKGKGGFVSYLGTGDVREAEKMAQMGDKKADIVLEAFSYRVAKEIGAYATVLKGEVDGIVLTGGIAHSKRITASIEERVKYIAPVHIFPGENEMEAMCQGALRVLRGIEKAREY